MGNAGHSWVASSDAPNFIACVLVVIDYGLLLKNVPTDLYKMLPKTTPIFPIQLIWSKSSYCIYSTACAKSSVVVVVYLKILSVEYKFRMCSFSRCVPLFIYFCDILVIII